MATSSKSRAKKPKSKSKVNEAGNYTKPALRKRLFKRIKAGGKGGKPGKVGKGKVGKGGKPGKVKGGGKGWQPQWANKDKGGKDICRNYHTTGCQAGDQCQRSHKCPIQKDGWICLGPHREGECNSNM